MGMDQTTKSPASTSASALATQAARGFAMGAADIVPGVSGGTVALILGIYQRLVDNIRGGAGVLGRLLRADIKGALEHLKTIDWAWLLSLLAGIGVAVIALSRLIETLLLDYPEQMAGLFLGLVVASVLIAAKLIDTWDPARYALAAAVAVGTFLLLGARSGTISNPAPWQFFVAGAIAICAMILPGISGSFLLLMLGMYAALIGAVNDREIADMLVFMVGAVAGLALFSTLLSWLLDRHGANMLAALIGLMIGSVRVLWPWPNGVGVISEDEAEAVSGTTLGWASSFSDFVWPTLLAVVAFVLVAGLAAYGDRRGAAAK